MKKVLRVAIRLYIKLIVYLGVVVDYYFSYRNFIWFEIVSSLCLEHLLFIWREGTNIFLLGSRPRYALLHHRKQGPENFCH